MHRNDIKVTALLSSLLLVIFLLIADLFILVEKCEEKIDEQQELISILQEELEDVNKQEEITSNFIDVQTNINRDTIEGLNGLLEIIKIMDKLK